MFTRATVQAKAAEQTSPAPARETHGGQPLETADLAFFGQGFGHDFSSVRVHTDRAAAASADALSARAYTIGSHIVLGPGEDAAGTAGRGLLAHELAHVVQQSRGGSARADAPGLEAEADRAGACVARGERVDVSGAGAVGIARWPTFQGKMWNLAAEIGGSRPVEDIVRDINGQSSYLRSQALEIVLRERKVWARKYRDAWERNENKSSGKTESEVASARRGQVRADEILAGLFAPVAINETAANLASGTSAPTASELPSIKDALRPGGSAGSAGGRAPFKRDIGDGKTYVEKLRKALPDIIADYYRQFADKRGKAEHDDPSKTRPIADLQRIADAAGRETDNVFGRIKKGAGLKVGVNIHDLWLATERALAPADQAAKRASARKRVFYALRTQPAIMTVNQLHHAHPAFTGTGQPVNDEATDQALVADEATATEADVRRLNEIDRGWKAYADSDQGIIAVQIFRAPDETSGPLKGKSVADRDRQWDMFQTFIHEYIHTLTAKGYWDYALTFTEGAPEYETLIEGVTTLFAEIVWSAIAPKVQDQALRDAVEGPEYSKLPPINVIPPAQRPARYPSYAQALGLVQKVGIRNLYAAYFLGDVEKIGGTKQP